MEDIHNDTTQGDVIESLPAGLFRVAVVDEEEEEDQIILAYVSGRMKIKKIRVLVGDKVIVKKDPYGGKGRIIQRL